MGFTPQIQKLPYKTTSFTLGEKGLNRNHFVNLDNLGRTNQSTVQIVLFRSLQGRNPDISCLCYKKSPI